MRGKGFTPLEMKSLTGFTLIEMAIVITVLIVLSATVVPLMFAAMRRAQLNSCAEQLASHLRHARSLAMTRTTPYASVVFLGQGFAEHSYQVCALSTATCQTAPINGPDRERDPLNPSKDLYVVYRNPPAGRSVNSECSGITITNYVWGAGGNRIWYFDNNGVPRIDTTNLLAAPGSVTLQNQAGQTLNVFVMPTTGAVYVQTP